MKVATKANGKTAYAAMSGMNGALTVAFTGGSVMGMAVVGGTSRSSSDVRSFGDPNVVTAFGFGASSIALFARVGGAHHQSR